MIQEELRHGLTKSGNGGASSTSDKENENEKSKQQSCETVDLDGGSNQRLENISKDDRRTCTIQTLSKQHRNLSEKLDQVQSLRDND